MVVESGLKRSNIQLSNAEKIALNALQLQAEKDKGSFNIHPHNQDEWGIYLIMKSLVRKGLAIVECNDAICINGWVAEFYTAEYHAEAS